jgi:hypothetical protein
MVHGKGKSHLLKEKRQKITVNTALEERDAMQMQRLELYTGDCLV